MRLVLVATLGLAACGFHPGAERGDAAVGGDVALDDGRSDAAAPDAQPPDAGLVDAAPDAAPDADTQVCARADGLLGGRCATATGTLAFDGPTFDTTADALCDANLADVCLVAAQTITTSSSVTVTGSRPLVLFAAQAITVPGLLSASSTAAVIGAGASANACNAATTLPDASGDGAGGGAGGSFGDAGGDGGSGNVNQGDGLPVMRGGTAGLPISVLAVRGGCSGQPGADGTTAGDHGLAGPGGGALYLFAGGSISISGAVTASGAGGGGGFDDSGGGGGGTGGLVGLESPTITVTGVIAANGGGGGGGGSILSPHQGGPGADGGATPFDVIAGGGSPGADSGTGGDGASAAAAASTPAAADGGGGGGGGGGGVVWVLGSITGTTISPAPQLH